MAEITVLVTDADIRDGWPEHYYQNPLARALIREYGGVWEVKVRAAIHFEHAWKEQGGYKITPRARQFLAAFSDGEPVHPQRLTLELTRGTVASPAAQGRPVIYSIPWQRGLVCTDCVRDIPDDDAMPAFANRDGMVWCTGCAPGGGLPTAGFDCETCGNRDCGCTEGEPGCEHFLCQAFAIGGIIREDRGPHYASCPGAPREVVAVRSFAQAIKFSFARLLSPEARVRLFGDGQSDGSAA